MNHRYNYNGVPTKNLITDEGDHLAIHTINKKVALISKDDLLIVANYRWSIYSVGNQQYAQAYNPENKGCIRLHSLLVGIHQEKHVDHINKNGLDNRRENLRIVSVSENLLNNDVRDGNLKRCAGCKEWMDLSWFYKSKTCVGSHCKKCNYKRKVLYMRDYNKKRNQKPEVIEKRKEYYKMNKERILEQQRSYRNARNKTRKGDDKKS